MTIINRGYIKATDDGPGAPPPAQLLELPWAELGIGLVEDFSTEVCFRMAQPPGSWPTRIYLAEITQGGRKIGQLYHVAMMSAEDSEELLVGLTHSEKGLKAGSLSYDAYAFGLGLSIGPLHLQAYQAESDESDPAERIVCSQTGAAYGSFFGFFNHDLFLELSPDEFRRIEDGINGLLAILFPRLPSPKAYAKMESYAQFLHRTKQDADPFLQSKLDHVGSCGHADFVRRNEIAATLIESLKGDKPLTSLAVGEAVKACGAPRPSLARRGDGTLIHRQAFLSFFGKYSQKCCPWYAYTEEADQPEPQADEMPAPANAPQTSPKDTADFLQDPTTVFRFSMQFIIEKFFNLAEDHYIDDYRSATANVDACFQLIVPDDRTQAPWLEYQIEENADYSHAVYVQLLPGDDTFCPRSRRLSADGLREIFAWLEEVNLWEWQPTGAVRVTSEDPHSSPAKETAHAPIDALCDLDVRYQHPESDFSDYVKPWRLEVVRGGRCFRQNFTVYGAPAPTAYAFEEGAWASMPTQMVPILTNHLLFLTNDPIVVGLTKRLLRLLAERKPKPQIAKFDDGRGTRYEVDFERMVARRSVRNHGLGLGRLGLLAPKLDEVVISEYDRMRLWAGLLEFKSTKAGLQPTKLMDGIIDTEPALGQRGRKWSGDICDGKQRFSFKPGNTTADDEDLRRRFLLSFAGLFSVERPGNLGGPLPRVTLPVSKYVVGGLPPAEAPRNWGCPLYTDTIEERIQRYRVNRGGGYWAGAMLGDQECMLKWGPPWLERAAQMGNPKAQVIEAHRLLGIARDSYVKKPDRQDPDGLARRYYEAAYKAGYLPAALGMGYLAQHGIGTPVDQVAAVAYYVESLGDKAEPLDQGHYLAYSALRDLYADPRGRVYDLAESRKYETMRSATITQQELKKARDDAKRSQAMLELTERSHQLALAKLSQAPSSTGFLPDSLDECEIVEFEDFSAFMSARGAPPEGFYVPMFGAQIKYQGKIIGTFFCINHSPRAQLSWDTCAGFRAWSGGTYGSYVRFSVHKGAARFVTSDDFEVGRHVEGAFKSRHRITYDHEEGVAGTPEWERHWVNFRKMMAKIRDRLGDPRDSRHPARLKYTDYLQAGGLSPNPFLVGVLPHVCSVGHAELVRRNQICQTLARTVRQHEALSDLAIEEAAKVTGMAIPDLRRVNGTLVFKDNFKAFVNRYIDRAYPWYRSVDAFLPEV